MHIGEYPAQDAEKATDITVPEGATFEQVADALRQGKAIASKQRIYMGEKGMRQAKAEPKAADKEQSKASTGRPDGWRTNALKARQVMKDRGIARTEV